MMSEGSALLPSGVAAYVLGSLRSFAWQMEDHVRFGAMLIVLCHDPGIQMGRYDLTWYPLTSLPTLTKGHFMSLTYS